MATETTWCCDWCRTRVENSQIPPFNRVDSTIILARRGPRKETYLFPDDMRGKEAGDKFTPSDFEGDLCDDCVKEILSAVLRSREVCISRRPK